MKILSFNIAGNRGRRRSGFLKRVAERILASEVDIVGLQEVVHHHDDHHPPDQVLAELTGFDCCFAGAHEMRDHLIGNAILSRQPISESITHDLPHSYPERRVLLEARTFSSDGVPITAFCTHLVHMGRLARSVRLAQAGAIARCMKQCWRPHFVVGDLNAGANAWELDPLRNHSGVDGTGHHGTLRSWPAKRPLVLYDQVWPGPGWVVESVEIVNTRLSDHRALLAELGWAGAPGFNVLPDPKYANQDPHAAAKPALTTD